MNNRMSYNDVEQLKRQIRARLGSTVNDVMNMANGVTQGIRQQTVQGTGTPKPMRSSNANMPPNPMRSSAAMPPMQSPNMMSQPMQPQNMRPQPMQSSMVPPQPMQSPNMRPQPMEGGAYFEKYDCGHDYPKMSMKQHIRSELDTDMQKKVENLQYAVVMSEVLGEPVSRKRRRRRSVAGR